ncbi:hypothetical protein ACWGOQ_0019290 [Aquimarina sp. M1]
MVKVESESTPEEERVCVLWRLETTQGEDGSVTTVSRCVKYRDTAIE